jgi:hypothetical protein
MTGAQHSDTPKPPAGAPLIRADYASGIGAAWQSRVIVIVQTGLTEAKAAPPHGEFQKRLERDHPFGIALGEGGVS